MKARRVLFNDFGGPEVMYVAQIDLPEIRDNEVLLKILAAGINPVDTKLRKGQSFLCNLIKEDKPWSLGCDVAGVVLKAGSEALFKKGDFVYGLVGHRVYPQAYSTHVVTDGQKLVKLPDGTKAQEAASLLTAGITASNIADMIEEDFKVRGVDNKTARVLVSGATGGVGHILIQILCDCQIAVTSLSKDADNEFLKSVDLENSLSYLDDNKSFAQSFDAVVDNIGGETGLSLFKYLKENGLLITVPTISRDFIKNNTPAGKRSDGVLSHSDDKLLIKLAQKLYSGDLRVNITGRYSLDDIAKAHKQIESGHTKGKLVLVPEL